MNFRQTQLNKPYFLLLLPVFFALHGFTQYYPLVLTGDISLLLLKYLIATAIITLIFFFFIRSWRSAAMLNFLVLFLYLFFGAIHDWLKTWLDNTFLVKYSFMLPAGFIIVLFLIIYLRKKKPAFLKLSVYLNILLFLLIVIDIVLLGYKMVNGSTNDTKRLPPNLTACTNCDKPDIYLIVADEYAGKKQLQEVFHFDNSAFENELRNRGFHIVDSSFSNYNQTVYSLASMLDMNYLSELDTGRMTFHNHRLSLRTINNNSLLDFLKAYDYEIKNYSIFQLAGRLPYETTHFFKTGLSLVTGQTLLSRINRDIRFNFAAKFKIQSEVQRIVNFELRTNESIYRRTWQEAMRNPGKPRFVYTHLFMPHYPFYFDRHGNRNALNLLVDSSQYDREKYVEYVQYSNQKFLELIDHILRHAKKPPIIIFMSDHGFREFFKNRNHFMTINSIYLPGKQYQNFYKGMSNVNQFRVLLNTQFRQQLPMLNDSTIFFPRE